MPKLTTTLIPLRLYKDVYSCLTPVLKRKLYLAFLLMILSGIAETSTVISILPFLTIAADSSSLDKILLSHPILSSLDKSSLLLAAASLFIFLSFISASIRLINLWFSSRFAALVGTHLSSQAFMRILTQPYSIFLSTNSSKYLATLSNHIDSTVFALNFLLQLVTSSFIALFVLASVIFLEPLTVLTLFLVLALLYLLLSFLTLNLTRQNGTRIAHLKEHQIQSAQETFGLIRDIIFSRAFSQSLKSYLSYDTPIRIASATNVFISAFPRYMLEAVSILLLVSIYLVHSSSSSSVAPFALLGVIALALQRLLPALQQVYTSNSRITGLYPSVQKVIDICQTATYPYSYSRESLSTSHTLELRYVSYSHSNSSSKVLSNISMTIDPTKSVGIIGETGSGKSTLLDIISCLLVPEQGQVLWGGIDLHSNIDHLTTYHSRCAYVSQDLYLSDSPLIHHLTSCSNTHDIDYTALGLALETAQLSEFIKSLPDGINTILGERGSNLSGGQRQRVSIARALYRSPQYLFFDEATSALDTNTEHQLINALKKNYPLVSFIMVAHRESSLRHVDHIFKLSNSQLSLVK